MTKALVSVCRAVPLLVCAHAYQSFRDKLPNGHNVKDCNGVVVPGVGHVLKAGAGERNWFGTAFAESGSGVWGPWICEQDSDGDGITNGEELGDPNCVWTIGEAPEFKDGITHPGLACDGPSPAPPTDIQLSGWGGHIEGVSVDPWGNLYATHFRNTNDNSSAGNNVGRNVIGKLEGGSASGGEAWYKIDPPEADAVYNGMKWGERLNGDPDVYVYVADVGQGKVMKLHSGYALRGYRGWEVHCSDPSWAAAGIPNDLALSQTGLIFLSGQDWGSSKGALWMCNPNGDAVQLEGDMGRTNGVALSPDGATLYLTEAVGSPVSWDGNPEGQRIWKYDVAGDGSISNKVEFFNFATDMPQPEAMVDADGMRTDVAGNLYVTRNGGAKVVVITPAGGLLKEIPLSLTNNPTNLDFSPQGDLLYVVGRCAGAPWSQGDGCVEVLPVPIPAPTPAPVPTPPTPATTPEPTSQPTEAPAPAQCCTGSGTGGEGCFTPCSSTGWCGASDSNCASCGGNWCGGSAPTPPAPTPVVNPTPTPPAPTPPVGGPSQCCYNPGCTGNCAVGGWCGGSESNCVGCGGDWCSSAAVLAHDSTQKRLRAHVA